MGALLDLDDVARGHPLAEKELRALRADAERYRWLRGDGPLHDERWSRWNLQRWDGRCWHSLERTALDAAVDAALAAKGSNQ